MSKYLGDFRAAYQRGPGKLKEFHRKVKDIRRSGRDEGWQQRATREAYAQAVEDMKEHVTLPMARAAQAARIDAAKAAEAARRGRDNPLDRDEATKKLFIQQRAEMHMGHVEEQAIPEAYEKAVAGLTEEEKEKYRWIVDDCAAALVRTPETRLQLEDTIEMYRTGAEQEALEDCVFTEVLSEHNKTLSGFLLEELKNVADGYAPADYPWEKFLADGVKNAQDQAYGPPDPAADEV